MNKELECLESVKSFLENVNRKQNNGKGDLLIEMYISKLDTIKQALKEFDVLKSEGK